MDKRLCNGVTGLALVGSVMLITACGGGGGGASAAPPAAPVAAGVPASKALADTPAPAGFDFASFRTGATLRSTALVADASRFADPTRTYVSLWYSDESGERQQLVFITLATLQALDARGGLNLSLPRGVLAVSYEVYDAAGATTALSGELRS